MTTASPHKATHSASARFDPAALLSIRNLELRAKIVVQGFWSGLHRSPYHGFSVEFTEYRQYTPGDDPRYLDWRLFARSDRFYIKKFEDETNLRCLMVLDTSASMQFGSGGISKADYARTLAASIGYFLHQQGDAVGLLSFDSQVRDYLPPRNRSAHLRHLFVTLQKDHKGSATSFSTPLSQVGRVFTKRGLLIVISDFLSPLEELGKGLGELAALGHEIILFQILDPKEIDFSFEKPALFQDLEEPRNLFVDPVAASHNYLAKFAAHQTSLEETCLASGIARHLFRTDTALQSALHALLRARSKNKTKRTRRNR